MACTRAALYAHARAWQFTGFSCNEATLSCTMMLISPFPARWLRSCTECFVGDLQDIPGRAALPRLASSTLIGLASLVIQRRSLAQLVRPWHWWKIRSLLTRRARDGMVLAAMPSRAAPQDEELSSIGCFVHHPAPSSSPLQLSSTQDLLWRQGRPAHDFSAPGIFCDQPAFRVRFDA